MTLEELRSALGWCTLLNFGVLLLWAVMFLLAHDWMHRVHGRVFSLSRERFDALHYGLMGVYKLGIVVFNVTPYLALRILA